MNETKCARCGRGRPNKEDKYPVGHGSLVRAYVYHTSYGCDTGCCGHVLVVEDVEGNTCSTDFNFEHAYSRSKEDFVKDLLNDVGFKDVPIDLDKCEIIED